MSPVAAPIRFAFALSILLAPRAPAQDHARAVETYYAGAIFRGEGGQDLAYRLFVPPGHGTGRGLPIILHLEGNGSQGNDLEGWRRWPQALLDRRVQEAHPCLFLTPRCRRGEMWTGAGGAGMSLRLAIELLGSVVASSGADRDRVYVVGFSMGGFAAWEAAIRWPRTFAAVVPIAGGGDPGRVAAMSGVPVWAFHGAADPVCPVSGTRRMVEALRTRGGEPRYSEYPGVGHGEVLGRVFGEPGFLDWLFARRK